MNEQQIRDIVQDELQEFLASDRYIFHKLVQMLDGRNIQLGKTTGTKIGTEVTQKLGFFNATPVVQQNVPLTSPTAQNIIDALVALGLVEQSD